MPLEGYRLELFRARRLYQCTGLIGLFFDATALGLLIATSLYCCRILYQTHRLGR